MLARDMLAVVSFHVAFVAICALVVDLSLVGRF